MSWDQTEPVSCCDQSRLCLPVLSTELAFGELPFPGLIMQTWPGILCIDQAGLELTEIFLPLPLTSWVKDIPPPCLACKYFLKEREGGGRGGEKAQAKSLVSYSTEGMAASLQAQRWVSSLAAGSVDKSQQGNSFPAQQPWQSRLGEHPALP